MINGPGRGLGHAQPVEHLARLEPGRNARLLAAPHRPAPHRRPRRLTTAILLKKDRDLAEHVCRPPASPGARSPGRARGVSQIPATASRPHRIWAAHARERRRLPGRSRRRRLAGHRRRGAPPSSLKTSAPLAEPARPIRPAAEYDDRKTGRRKKKMPTNAATASAPQKHCFLSARLPMRNTASSTMASTAALRPKNNATTSGTLPKSGVGRSSGPMMGHDAGAPRNRPPAIRPAQRAMHQPADIGRELAAPPDRAAACNSLRACRKRRSENPALLLDHDAMHHRDLPGRTAESSAGRTRDQTRKRRRGSDTARGTSPPGFSWVFAGRSRARSRPHPPAETGTSCRERRRRSCHAPASRDRRRNSPTGRARWRRDRRTARRRSWARCVGTAHDPWPDDRAAKMWRSKMRRIASKEQVRAPHG